MPHPLSDDLRKRGVAFVRSGNSCNHAARHFDTSVPFAVNLMSLYRAAGSIEPRPIGGKRHGKLDVAEVFLKALVVGKPDVTMPELAAALMEEKGIRVAPQSLSRWLINKGFSFKKSLRASEQDRPDLVKARAEWKDGRQPIMREQRGRLIFIDETATNTKMTRLRGPSLKGERLNSKAPLAIGERKPSLQASNVTASSPLG